MTAFDRAWRLLKMPVHGTGRANWEKIKREGLAPSAPAGAVNSGFRDLHEGEEELAELTDDHPLMAGDWSFAIDNENADDAWNYALEHDDPVMIYIDDSADTGHIPDYGYGDIYGHVRTNKTIPPDLMTLIHEASESYDPQSGVEHEDWRQRMEREFQDRGDIYDMILEGYEKEEAEI